MHKAFYKFDSEPFNTQPDSSFFWLGEKFKEALSVLRYGILDNKGFVLLLGAPGIGKTTLLSALTETLPEDIVWALIPDPNLEKMELFNAIATGFQLQKHYASKVEFMLDFGTFLQEAYDQHKKVLLIIDAAHLLNQENLEELRLLSNMEKVDTKLINIFFVAQPQFNSFLTRPKNSAIRQRLNLTHTIEPLTAQETGEYIEHRFRVAGVENRVLTEKAVRSIHQFAGGVPRKINIICQQVLIDGAAQGRRIIDQGSVQECMHKLARSDNPNRTEFVGTPIKQRSGRTQKKLPRGVVTLLSAVVLFSVLLFAGYSFLFNGPSIDVSQAPPTTPPAGSLADSRKEPVAVVSESSKPLTTASEKPAPIPSSTAASAISSDSIRPGSGSPAGGTVVTKNDGLSQPAQKTAATERAPVEIVTATVSPQQVETISTNGSNSTTELATVPKATARPDSEDLSNSEDVAFIVTGGDPVHDNLPVPTGARAPQTALVKAVLPLQANALTLTAAGEQELEKFLRAHKQTPHRRIEVRGYVSAKDNSPENIKLSLARAEAIAALLLKKGVKSEALVVRAMGNQDPLASNDTGAGRNKNRRVELELLP